MSTQQCRQVSSVREDGLDESGVEGRGREGRKREVKEENEGGRVKGGGR